MKVRQITKWEKSIIEERNEVIGDYCCDAFKNRGVPFRFKYCPFCGTKIEFLEPIEVEETKAIGRNFH